MRYMSLYKPGYETTDLPTAEHMAAMGSLIEEMSKAGTLIETGGLEHSKTGFRVEKDGPKVTVTDGPFAEAKEVIGGYAVLEAKNRDEAVVLARRFLDVAGGGVCEIRPMHQAFHCATV